MYYDRDGTPIDLHEWARIVETDPDYKRVGLTMITDAAVDGRTVNVSTVWLGIDHSFGMGGPPLIFETMVFPDGSWLDERCERYATIEQARAGHLMVVIEVAQEMTDPITMEPE